MNVIDSLPLRISGEVIARDVPYDDFLTRFDGQRVEWINGTVITMSPVSSTHNDVSVFLITLFSFYVKQTGGGRVFHDPMVMRPTPESPARSPDVQVVLPGGQAVISDHAVNGPADLVVEIVSPESQRRDRVEKFSEYERGGVREYWIIDPIHREVLFYQRGADGLFTRIQPDEAGTYHSRALDRFHLNVAVLTTFPLPVGPEVADLVSAMLAETNDTGSES